MCAAHVVRIRIGSGKPTFSSLRENNRHPTLGHFSRIPIFFGCGMSLELLQHCLSQFARHAFVGTLDNDADVAMCLSIPCSIGR